jgi:hypothetical protein
LLLMERLLNDDRHWRRHGDDESDEQAKRPESKSEGEAKAATLATRRQKH